MTFIYEKTKLKNGFHYIIGCDEVGRGCLAGPVVAAAVILKSAANLAGVRDSKLLSPEKREQLSAVIKDNALAWSIAEVSQEQVDKINIHNASLLAMKKSVGGLLASLPGVILRPSEQIIGAEESQTEILPPHLVRGQDDADNAFLFVDGKFKVPNLDIEQEAIIGGDNKVLSIAAASILAKVYRDRLMQKLGKEYPIYNFAQHKGYATLYHRKMIIQNGLSPIHRLSFCQNLTV